MLRHLVAALLVAPALPAQRPPSLGDFDGATDVGAARRPGSATYDAARQEYVIAARGVGGAGAAGDDFRYVWKRLTGDFILTARARPLARGARPRRALGWSVRASLAPDAPHATAAVYGDGRAALRVRRAASGDTEERRAAAVAPDVVQLERRGGALVMSVARFGDTLVTERVDGVALGDTVYVGLFVAAHDGEERVAFRDVRVTIPAREGFVPYREYLGAAVELLDVASGHRAVVHRSPEALQAPNWTPDGRALIYNERGRMYRFDLATRAPSLIETGPVRSNNNDHVLSFDGRTLGLSSGVPAEGNGSFVFTVPVGGGTPTRVTPLGPSYLHGWSPDGRHLLYTAQRNGDFDIYRIPAAGGEEVRLTTTPGLDDGSEYSPDGRWIYFNSVRSGTMQLWRMRPDGSAPERLTSDGYNDWFPHVSPDGKWVAFLSYMPDVAPSDHPWYKRVYLRLMPAGGGKPRVIAYVYGGQGTMNVPSWSPDSRRLAFVSNSAPLPR